MSRCIPAFAAVAALALTLSVTGTASSAPAADPVPAAAAALPAFPGVGFQYLQIPDGSGPPVEVGVWYPAAADAPLVPSRAGTYVLKLALLAVSAAHVATGPRPSQPAAPPASLLGYVRKRPALEMSSVSAAAGPRLLQRIVLHCP